MSYTRPHEDRLADGTPSVDDVPHYTGTGTAQWGPGGGSGTVVGFIAECNTSPSGTVTVPWDAFYDIDFGVIGGPPAGVQLSYAAGVFTALADGFYRANLGVDIVVNPGSSGHIRLQTPNYGYPIRLEIASTGNASQWVNGWAFPMRSGQTFSLEQQTASAIDGYATLEIYRTAGSIS